jgi:hypothetical protein
MQVSVGSGDHIGKCILRIPKGALNGLRNESNTTKRSPKTIGSTGVIIREPKAHVIPLAIHGRENLINKAVTSRRTGLQREASRVRVGAVDISK